LSRFIHTYSVVQKLVKISSHGQKKTGKPFLQTVHFFSVH